MMSPSSKRTRPRRIPYSFRSSTTPNLEENAPKTLKFRQGTSPIKAKRCSEKSVQDTSNTTRTTSAQLQSNTPNLTNNKDNKVSRSLCFPFEIFFRAHCQLFITSGQTENDKKFKKHKFSHDNVFDSRHSEA